MEGHTACACGRALSRGGTIELQLKPRWAQGCDTGHQRCLPHNVPLECARQSILMEELFLLLDVGVR